MAVSESTARYYIQNDPDVRLMLEVRDDSAIAFEELMVRYQRRVVTVLEHMVQSRDQAEDLFQEVFLRVYRARKSYSPEAKFSTWLFTIVNHAAFNALRKRSRRPEVHLDASLGSGSMPINSMERIVLASSGQIPARQLDKAEMRHIVRLALESLNDRQRTAVLLNKFEGMSYAEIAQTMDLSPEAIKSLLSRARVNLRDVLEPYFESGDPPIASN